jgi:GNAT superfamily N-acetyltransferase
MEPVEFQREDFFISTDPSRLDLEVIHQFLANEAYWSPQVPREIVEIAIAHSLPFGLYVRPGGEQVGFARVVTDHATFAYLADVFILPEFRGRGLSKWLVTCILSHPDLQGLRRWMLATRDAHELYARYGFQPLGHPERYMEMVNLEIYRRGKT